MSNLDKIFSTIAPSNNTNEVSIFSYKHILSDIQHWRQSGGVHGDDHSTYDQPGHVYFRLYFHFLNSNELVGDKIKGGSGLLHPTWEFVDEKKKEEWDDQDKYPLRAEELKLWNYSTAWSYLRQNGEDDRALYLKHFIELLSNLNSNSPWVFQKVSGLGEALNRLQVDPTQQDYSQKKAITITCLDDTIDQRLGTLMDLYRAAMWSWRTKREIVPANLRKFDMTIVIFQSPIRNLHISSKRPKITDALGMASKLVAREDDNDAVFDPFEKYPGKYMTSYKTIELHNCEFNMNGSKDTYNELDNAEGTNQQFVLEITFDDAYESRYNEFLGKTITDILSIDQPDVKFDGPDLKIDEIDPFKTYTEKELNEEEYEEAYAKKAPQDHVAERFPSENSITNQLVGAITKPLSSQVNKILLGNIFGFSLEKTAGIVSELASGDMSWALSQADAAVRNKINHDNQPDTRINESIGDGSAPPAIGDPSSLGNIAQPEKYISSRQKELGNIFKSNTIYKSIL